MDKLLTFMFHNANFAEASEQRGASQQAPAQQRRSSGSYTLFQRLSFRPYKRVRLCTSLVVKHYLNGKVKVVADKQTKDGLDLIVKYFLKLI